MKILLFFGLVMSLSSFAQQGAGYGNPRTFTSPNAGLGNAAPETTGIGTDIKGSGNLGTGSMNTGDVAGSDGAATMPSGNADPRTETNENLERSNTSVTPIPQDTTLQGKSQTGPYKTPGNKQSQESSEEVLDYRTIKQKNQ